MYYALSLRLILSHNLFLSLYPTFLSHNNYEKDAKPTNKAGVSVELGQNKKSFHFLLVNVKTKK